MQLTVEQVLKINSGVFFRPEDHESDRVSVTSYARTVDYSASRLVAFKPQILELLAELPDEFRSRRLGGGGGWSFLNMCTDRHGRFWGEHAHVDVLLGLGFAIHALHYPFPPIQWPTLAGAMPYVEILTLEL